MIKAILMDFGDTIVVEEEGKRLSDMALEPVKGVEGFLEEFSSSVAIAILSNTLHSRKNDIQRLVDELGYSKHIREVFTSLDIGHTKPDPRIYHFALKALAIQPEETLMIGDRLDTDILGASRAGIRSLHLHWRSRHDGKSVGSGVRPTYQANTYEAVSRIIRDLQITG